MLGNIDCFQAPKNGKSIIHQLLPHFVIMSLLQMHCRMKYFTINERDWTCDCNWHQSFTPPKCACADVFDWVWNGVFARLLEDAINNLGHLPAHELSINKNEVLILIDFDTLRLLHAWNGFHQKEVAELGILIKENARPAKAPFQMNSTYSGIAIDSKSWQQAIALSPMEVTDLGICTDFIFEHKESACLQMDLTPSNSTNNSILSRKQFHWVSFPSEASTVLLSMGLPVRGCCGSLLSRFKRVPLRRERWTLSWDDLLLLVGKNADLLTTSFLHLHRTDFKSSPWYGPLLWSLFSPLLEILEMFWRIWIGIPTESKNVLWLGLVHCHF